MNVDTIDKDFIDNFKVIYEIARDHIEQYDYIADWWDLKCKSMIVHFRKQYR